MSGIIRFFSPIEHAVFVEYLTYQIKAIYKIDTDDVDLSLMKHSLPVICSALYLEDISMLPSARYEFCIVLVLRSRFCVKEPITTL